MNSGHNPGINPGINPANSPTNMTALSAFSMGRGFDPFLRPRPLPCQRCQPCP